MLGVFLLKENPYGVIVPRLVDWLLKENPYGVYPVRDYLSIEKARRMGGLFREGY